ncbi:MAG: DUF6789 family protein [Halohasta sp.]
MSSESETRSSKQISRESGQIGVREISVAGLSGLVGMIAMQPIFGVATVLGVLDPVAFSGFANIVGYGLNFWGGVAIFVLGGITVLPLMFITLGNYLPPASSISLRGVTYGTIVWTGFALAFYTGQSGAALVIYLVMTLVNHWIYGAVLGRVYTQFASIAAYEV